MPEPVESVQSKRAKSVLRHLTAATATGTVAVAQTWAAMEDWDDDDVRHAPLRIARLAGSCRRLRLFHMIVGEFNST